MRVIIIGNHMASYARAGLLDEGKAFYERKMEDLYYTPLEGRVPLEIEDEEGNITMDEVMIYREGDIVPDMPVPYIEFYDQDVILGHMQEHKMMSAGGLMRPNTTWSGVKEFGKWIWAYFPLILAAGVLVYAVI